MSDDSSMPIPATIAPALLRTLVTEVLEYLGARSVATNALETRR